MMALFREVREAQVQVDCALDAVDRAVLAVLPHVEFVVHGGEFAVVGEPEIVVLHGLKVVHDQHLRGVGVDDGFVAGVGDGIAEGLGERGQLVARDLVRSRVALGDVLPVEGYGEIELSAVELIDGVVRLLRGVLDAVRL